MCASLISDIVKGVSVSEGREMAACIIVSLVEGTSLFKVWGESRALQLRDWKVWMSEVATFKD